MVDGVGAVVDVADRGALGLEGTRGASADDEVRGEGLDGQVGREGGWHRADVVHAIFLADPCTASASKHDDWRRDIRTHACHDALQNVNVSDNSDAPLQAMWTFRSPRVPENVTQVAGPEILQGEPRGEG